MKKQPITTIGTVAIVLAFSVGCSQSKVDDLNAQLKISQETLSRTQGDLANAKRAQGEAEQAVMIAQNQAETALAKLAEQQQSPIQNQPETAGGKPSGNPTSKKSASATLLVCRLAAISATRKSRLISPSSPKASRRLTCRKTS